MESYSSLLSRFDAAEYRLCRRLNRGIEHAPVRVFFMTASRLGDGVIWYALMLALPLIFGAQGLRVALLMLASGAVSLAVYKLLKRTFVRERPFIRYAGISLAGAPLDRYSFPSGHTLHDSPKKRNCFAGSVMVSEAETSTSVRSSGECR